MRGAALLQLPAGAEPLQIFGYAGVLGEWELIANVTGNEATKDFSGPFTMTHVGICTVDGPEERKGEIRFRLIRNVVTDTGDILDRWGRMYL